MLPEAITAGIAMLTETRCISELISDPMLILLANSRKRPILASGPYRLVRHPGYGGLLLTWAGAGLATAN
jgi:protein-S-isoprenylcysteine O-methyltransferase Ste14